MNGLGQAGELAGAGWMLDVEGNKPVALGNSLHIDKTFSINCQSSFSQVLDTPKYMLSHTSSLLQDTSYLIRQLDCWTNDVPKFPDARVLIPRMFCSNLWLAGEARLAMQYIVDG